MKDLLFVAFRGLIIGIGAGAVVALLLWPFVLGSF